MRNGHSVVNFYSFILPIFALFTDMMKGLLRDYKYLRASIR